MCLISWDGIIDTESWMEIMEQDYICSCGVRYTRLGEVVGSGGR